MTVAEMIAALQKLPQDAPVKVEGYAPDTADSVGSGAAFEPNHIEAVTNEIVGVTAVIWAAIVTD